MQGINALLGRGGGHGGGHGGGGGQSATATTATTTNGSNARTSWRGVGGQGGPSKDPLRASALPPNFLAQVQHARGSALVRVERTRALSDPTPLSHSSMEDGATSMSEADHAGDARRRVAQSTRYSRRPLSVALFGSGRKLRVSTATTKTTATAKSAAAAAVAGKGNSVRRRDADASTDASGAAANANPNMHSPWEGRRSLQLSMSIDPESELGFTERVSAASLERLVEYVVSSNEFMASTEINQFLLTYHSFVNPQGLLGALAARFDAARQANDIVVQIRTLFVLQRWLEAHFEDVEDEAVLLPAVARFAEVRLASIQADNSTAPHAVTVAEPPLAGHPPDAASGNHAIEGLLRKLIAFEAQLRPQSPKGSKLNHRQSSVGEESDEEEDAAAGGPPVEFSVLPNGASRPGGLIHLELTPAPVLPSHWPSSFHKIVAAARSPAQVLASPQLSRKEMARQLTLIEHALFSRIPVKELLHGGKDAPNTRAMITHFNLMSRFVATCICLVKDMHARVRVYRRFVRLADEALKLNNFNLVFEVHAGLNSVAVYRLKHTRSKALKRGPLKAMMERISDITSRRGNYSAYRHALDESSVPVRPTVPFLGVALTDLSFLDDVRDDKVQNEYGDALINYAKHRRIAKVVAQLKSFQDHQYNLQPVVEIRDWLWGQIHERATLTDKQLYSKSVELEPSAGTMGGGSGGVAADTAIGMLVQHVMMPRSSSRQDLMAVVKPEIDEAVAGAKRAASNLNSKVSGFISRRAGGRGSNAPSKLSRPSAVGSGVGPELDLLAMEGVVPVEERDV